MIVPLEDDLVNSEDFFWLLLKIIENCIFQNFVQSENFFFKYDTYRQYQLNITKKSEKKTFEIVYWSQMLLSIIIKFFYWNINGQLFIK